MRELKERQAEIATRIDQHQDGAGSFRTTQETLISVASRAADMFARSKAGRKRELALVFSNLLRRGRKLESTMRSPFHLMVGRADDAGWLGDLDSNQGCSGQSREFYR